MVTKCSGESRLYGIKAFDSANYLESILVKGCFPVQHGVPFPPPGLEFIGHVFHVADFQFNVTDDCDFQKRYFPNITESIPKLPDELANQFCHQVCNKLVQGLDVKYN